jgi:hypothetical protein
MLRESQARSLPACPEPFSAAPARFTWPETENTQELVF